MATIAGDSGRNTLYGTPEGDLVVGYADNDNLYGYEGNDDLRGDGRVAGSDTTGNDYLFGGRGNDTLTGGPGNDYIDGAAYNIVPELSWRGVGEYDVLTGGPGNDQFVLGDRIGPYYQDANNTFGFALITDFDIGRDSITLAGLREYYSFNASSVNPYNGSPDTGTEIYLNGSYSITGRLDLIAYVQGVPSSNLEPTSGQFEFVSSQMIPPSF